MLGWEYQTIMTFYIEDNLKILETLENESIDVIGAGKAGDFDMVVE